MGLISQIPVPEEVAKDLSIADMKNPDRLIDKTINTYKVSRRFCVDPHQKKHLFGKSKERVTEPLKKRLFE